MAQRVMWAAPALWSRGIRTKTGAHVCAHDCCICFWRPQGFSAVFTAMGCWSNEHYTCGVVAARRCRAVQPGGGVLKAVVHPRVCLSGWSVGPSSFAGLRVQRRLLSFWLLPVLLLFCCSCCCCTKNATMRSKLLVTGCSSSTRRCPSFFTGPQLSLLFGVSGKFIYRTEPDVQFARE